MYVVQIVVCPFVLFLLAIVLSVLLSFGHCVVCPSVFWPLCCLSFCLLAIVLSVLLRFYGFWLPLCYLQTLLLKWSNKEYFILSNLYFVKPSLSRRLYQALTLKINFPWYVKQKEWHWIQNILKYYDYHLYIWFGVFWLNLCSAHNAKHQLILGGKNIWIITLFILSHRKVCVLYACGTMFYIISRYLFQWMSLSLMYFCSYNCRSLLGTDHLTCRGGGGGGGGGGYVFLSKKIFWFPMLLKKIFWFWWREKQIIWLRVFVI